MHFPAGHWYNIAAHYYLGKSLQALVEQEILTEAEQAYQTYLNAGSPLGQEEEVEEFLKSRKESKAMHALYATGRRAQAKPN